MTHPPRDAGEVWALVEIYKAAVETADRVSDRRQQANAFYITLVSAAFTGFFAAYSAENLPRPAQPGVCVFGLLISAVWLAAIVSFRRHNSAKFKALLELEAQLPFAFFETENQRLNAQRLRTRFTTIEMALPFISAAAFLVLLFIATF
jgi:hypothetical protein